MFWLKRVRSLFPLLLGVALVAFLFVAPAALASGITVSPTSGSIATTFVVVANGFHPYEHVATWLGRPDGTFVGTGTTVADESGTIQFSVNPNSDWALGNYQVVAHGSSGLQLFTYFTITEPGVPIPGVTPEAGSLAVSIQQLKQIAGRVFIFNGAHYEPNELVWVWYTRPDGVTVTFGKVYANIFGNVYFPVTLGTDWMFGAYEWSGAGQESKHVAQVTFAYFDDKISNVVASDPVRGQPIYFEFVATGFQPWERISMWIQGPNEKNYILPNIRADGNGKVVWTTYLPRGLPCGNYRIVVAGLLSHHLYYKDYQYCF